MTDSLSLVLPVHNAQSWLSGQIRELLDLLPELTNDFQIIVVDDGSSDHTSEVAHDLSRQYPQVTLVHCRKRVGTSAASQAGISCATADFVFVLESDAAIHLGDLCRLWRMRRDPELVPARAQPRPLSESLIRRLSRWGRSVCDSANGESQTSGIQLVRREDAHEATPEVGTMGATANQPAKPAASTIPAPGPAGDDLLVDWSVKAIYS